MKYFLVLISISVCAVLGAWLAMAGATIAGLPPTSSGSWDLRPLLYVGIGAITGAISLVVFLLIMRRMEFGVRLVMSVVVSFVLAFLSGSISYPLSIWHAKLSAAEAKEKLQEEQRLYGEYYAAIRFDPGIVVRKQWFVKWAPQWNAYFDSLSDPTIQYTPDLLAEIYRGRIYKEHTSRVLEHPAFDPKLLESEFHRFFKQSRRSNDHELLVAVLSNPQAKDAWYEMVAASAIFEDAEPSSTVQNAVHKWRDRQGHREHTPDKAPQPKMRPSEEN